MATIAVPLSARLPRIPIKFAGHQTCETCHSDVLDVKSSGKHAHVNCEACHGALAKHADDPSAVTPVLSRYDRALRALPYGQRGQAQRLSAGRAGRPFRRTGMQDCHKPHSPEIGCRRRCESE